MGGGSRKPRVQIEHEDEAISRFLIEKAEAERQKQGRFQTRTISTAATRDRLFLEQLGGELEAVFKNKIEVRKYVPKKKKKTERILNALWSDHHYGSMLDPRETGHRFGPVEEARRLAAQCVQLADYKRHYRDETELFLHIAGDIIQGQLHDPRDGAPLAQQIATANYLLVQAIQFLASEFKKVTIRCTPGNHGRNTMRHKERAVNQKWDSFETALYFALKTAFTGVDNVSIEIGYKPYYIYEAFGERGFITHGDTVINPGYPGKTIDVANVRKQINEYNATQADHEKVKLFAVGHVHVGGVVHLPNGAIFMSNGCLLPPDAYAQSIGIFDTACGQWIWESVPGHILGDHRFAVVDEHTDKDSALDKIIKPFEGF